MGTFYGRTYYDASSLSDKSVYQPFSPTSNRFLKAVRIWVVIYNNPTFTSLNMKIYENASGAPGALLATSSNSVLKTSLITAPNVYGVRGIYFEFDNEVPLRSGETYHLVLNASGASSFSSTSHIAWIIETTDPIYSSANTDEQFYKNPMSAALLSSEIE